MSGFVDPGDFQTVFDAHLLEAPTWRAVAKSVDFILREIALNRGLHVRVESRAKDTGSLLGKVARKGRVDISTYMDLAGARIVVPFGSNVETIVDAIAADERVRVVEIDRKVPEPSSLEYKGVHIDLELIAPLDPPPSPLVVTRPLYCEVQVKTLAQSLWAELSHLVTYKRAVPTEVDRRVRRLLALCEIIDDEIEGAMDAVRQTADLMEQVAETLERAYYGLTGRRFDREASLSLLEGLMPSIQPEEAEGYVQALEGFVVDQAPVLRGILADRPEVRGIPMLTRPESVLVFERLTNSPMRFRVFWRDRFRPDTLERLERVWGDPLTR